ncbi:pseudouridine synthase [Phaeobacter italicus]|uniref:pseudouridine synthase n=2 Tax=Phaeobacter italicus TaxID=481446 RepID=UPI001C949B95|nr:pseudouridine synthase [Phaeobacter italicus]MBY5975708.1 pseudouridine synthase [Phaeobacter italicus]MEC8016885.1 pseudouridine synthase [Pseudomonadota bacterium]
MTRLIRFNKPYDVLPQFTDRGSTDSPRATLSDWIDLPGVYPAGRLDRDSEGLMLLTDQGRLQAWISDPQHKMPKTYWVQVEGTPDAAAITALAEGVELKDGLTRPAKARLIAEPEGLWARNPPIRVRKSVPDSWIELTIREGRNRQVRRMTAAVGHPTLRLIRAAIGAWTLNGLGQGQWEDLEVPNIPGPPRPKHAPNRQAIARRHAREEAEAKQEARASRPKPGKATSTKAGGTKAGGTKAGSAKPRKPRKPRKG